MAEFCSQCTLVHFDIVLLEIASKLKKGCSETFICEGCNNRAVFKDEVGTVTIEKVVPNGEIL